MCAHSDISYDIFYNLFRPTHADTHRDTQVEWQGQTALDTVDVGKVVSSSSNPQYMAEQDQQWRVVTLPAPSGPSLCLCLPLYQYLPPALALFKTHHTTLLTFTFISDISAHTHRDTLLLFTINVCMQRGESICLSRVHIDFTQRPANAREQNQSSVL